MKNCFLLSLLTSCLLSCSFTGNKGAERDNLLKPNVIVILIDDAGYIDFGFMGSEDLETPHIDKLAKSGTVFTDAHVSATVCAPSRAGIITGQYQQRFGFEANGTGYGGSGDIGLSDEVPTIADVFKEKGYATIAMGKWHLGATKNNHPNSKGFDEFYGFLGGSRSYFPLDTPSKTKTLQHNGSPVKFEGYLTDVLGNQSVKYIRDNKEKPFFMYLAYNAVHTPMEAKKIHLDKYKEHPRKKLAAMTWSLDENIGKLIAELEQQNLLDNTLIYFLSDNGGAANNSSKMGLLKGWKGNKFEGGHRVPFIMSWKGKIKNNNTFSGLSSSLDIFATSLDAANISKEDLLLDGLSLLPFVTGERKGNPHDKLYWRKLEEAAVRVGNDKLIRLDNYGDVLYNLSNDIGENNNLIKSNPSRGEALKTDLEQWEAKMMEPLWGEDEKWMSVTRYIHEQLMENKEVEYTSPIGLDNEEKH